MFCPWRLLRRIWTYLLLNWSHSYRQLFPVLHFFLYCEAGACWLPILDQVGSEVLGHFELSFLDFFLYQRHLLLNTLPFLGIV